MTPSERVTRAAADFTIGRMQAIRDRPGNPRDVHIQRFGSATATLCGAQPDLDFMNYLVLLDAVDAGRADDITAFYRAHGVRGWVELPPGPGAEIVYEALTRAGWSEASAHASFAGPLSADGSESPHVEVRPVNRAAQLGDFAAALLAGHDVPEEERAEAGADLEGWLARPGWRLYLACVDGEPAAAAVLTIDDGAAYLANAATRPEHRRQGCQTALLHRRLRDGRDAGCDIACALAAPGSASQRNLERAGLRRRPTPRGWRRPACPRRAPARATRPWLVYPVPVKPPWPGGGQAPVSAGQACLAGRTEPNSKPSACSSATTVSRAL
ncbi:MAG: GNAT family N-acetyltransferase [Gaiellales bacterium]